MNQLKLLEFPVIEDFSAYRMEVIRKPVSGLQVAKACSPQEVANYIYSLGLAEHPQEHFVVLHVNTRNLIIGHTVVSVGLLDRSHVHPREVFAPALINGGTAKVILAHNHPSGSTQPSVQDKQITQKLVDAGELLGVEVVDHIIVSYDLEKEKRAFVSFKQNGLMRQEFNAA